MKVICSGYKSCIFRLNCYHSTPHEYEEDDCSNSVFHNKDCECNKKNLMIYSRKDKLKTLKNDNYEEHSEKSKK